MKTTQDLIKILPFAPEFKNELLENFDLLTDDQRFAIERVVWRFYYAQYDDLLDENLQKAFKLAEQNKEDLDENFFARVHKQTDHAFQKETSEGSAQADLLTARDELSKILAHPKHKTAN